MTKYVSFKIFDSEDHPYGFEGIKDKQVKKYYTWVHEDYYEGVIKAELDQLGKCQYCGEKEYDEPHYDCQAEHNMIARKEAIADMEYAMSGEQEYED